MLPLAKHIYLIGFTDKRSISNAEYFTLNSSGDNYLERCKYAVMVLGVLANPRVAVIDVRLIDVLIDDLRHHHKPLRQEVRLLKTT